jgi:hypothetical protein
LNNSQEIVTKLISSVHLQNQLTEKVKHQQYIQEKILNNAIKLKQLARTNIDKTQDILTNVIQVARHEYNLLKQVKYFNQILSKYLFFGGKIRFVHYRKLFKQLYE